MRKILLLSSFLLLFLGSYSQSNWIAGGEIQYFCTDTNEYVVKLIVNKDCSKVIAQPDSLPVNFSSASLNIDTVVYFSFLNQIDVYSDKHCSDYSVCNGGSRYGIISWVYEKQMYLATANDWVFEFNGCCRTETDNFYSNSSSGIYFYATLNNLDEPLTSSPYTWRGLYFEVLKDQPEILDLGFYSDDSTSIELVAPMLNDSQNVTWKNGFAALNPFHSITPVTFNSYWQSLMFTSDTSVLCQYALKASNWKEINGVLVCTSTSIIDNQININDGDEWPIPFLSGIDKDMMIGHYSPLLRDKNITVFAGEEIKFNLYIHDPDTNAVKEFGMGRYCIEPTFYDSAIIVRQNNFTDSAYLSFNWQTSMQNIADSIKLEVAVHDLFCLKFEKRYYTYYLHILDPNVSNSEIEDEQIELQLYPNPSRDIINYKLEGLGAFPSIDIEVFDAYGKVAYQSVNDKKEGIVDIEKFESGLYFFKVIINGQICLFKKVIKTN